MLFQRIKLIHNFFWKKKRLCFVWSLGSIMHVVYKNKTKQNKTKQNKIKHWLEFIWDKKTTVCKKKLVWTNCNWCFWTTLFQKNVDSVIMYIDAEIFYELGIRQTLLYAGRQFGKTTGQLAAHIALTNKNKVKEMRTFGTKMLRNKHELVRKMISDWSVWGCFWSTLEN